MSLHYEHVQTKIGFGKDKTDKYVGKRRLADPFDIKRLAKEVSHITGQREAQVLITLQFLTQAIEDAIQDGRSIDLGFGTLSPAITTKAADEASDVKVVGKRVLFRASKELREIVQKMSVRLISDQDDGTSDTEDDDDPDGDGGSTGGLGSSEQQQQTGAPGIMRSNDTLPSFQASRRTHRHQERWALFFIVMYAPLRTPARGKNFSTPHRDFFAKKFGGFRYYAYLCHRF